MTAAESGTRLSVSLDRDTTSTLDGLVTQDGTSKAKVIARAVRVYWLVATELAAGRQLAFHDPKTGETSRVHLL